MTLLSVSGSVPASESNGLWGLMMPAKKRSLIDTDTDTDPEDSKSLVFYKEHPTP